MTIETRPARIEEILHELHTRRRILREQAQTKAVEPHSPQHERLTAAAAAAQALSERAAKRLEGQAA